MAKTQVLTVEVYSEVWGWDTENAYYEGTGMWDYMLTHSVVANHMAAVNGAGFITNGLRDGSRRYRISQI